MQRLIWLAGGLTSPAILIALVWCSAFASIAIGPIDYPGQPSAIVSAVIATGVALFLAGFVSGKFVFNSWFARHGDLTAPSARTLNHVVHVASLTSIAGIGLIALDRTVLSGVGNYDYSELLRCAPGLVDVVAINRTPLLYLGYVTFSFGFVSVVLFILKGEEIRGWAAALAQFSIVSPVGYAVLYSGRMSILFVLVLIVAVMLVRLSEGRGPLPAGHHLLLKLAVVVGLFAIYSSWIWSSRQTFCTKMTPLIQELQEKGQRALDQERPSKPERAPNRPASEAAGGEAGRPKSSQVMTAAELNEKFAEARATAKAADTAAVTSPAKTFSADAIIAMMLEAWNVRPREYVTSAMQSGRLSQRAELIGLSSYFYLTHGIRTVDAAWQARDKISPKWGVYEIGVLSPILRVFFPGNQLLAVMETELRSAGIFGFFPTAWGAAFIDFGISGAIVYVLIWGFVAGWSAAGSRRSGLMTPSLLLIFVLTSILLSPIQGPLGVSNSALVLVSILVTGITLDAGSLRSGSRRKPRDLQVGGTAR